MRKKPPHRNVTLKGHELQLLQVPPDTYLSLCLIQLNLHIKRSSTAADRRSCSLKNENRIHADQQFLRIAPLLFITGISYTKSNTVCPSHSFSSSNHSTNPNAQVVPQCVRFFASTFIYKAAKTIIHSGNIHDSLKTAIKSRVCFGGA